MSAGATDETELATEVAGRPGLRERRRRETLRDIADAALDLFERDGVAATTVDGIAAAAGVSPRTFFRLCSTKEQAVLTDDGDVESTVLAAVAELGPDDDPAAELERCWDHLARAYDADPAGHHRVLRVRRLMTHEPTLLAAGLRQDAERTERLVAALVEATGMPLLRARAVAARFSTVLQLSFEEWAHRAEAGEAASLVDIYTEVRTVWRSLG
ncbi:TetR/AcrR family transcriptional regulator [Desertihabitans aurantiacus]|uniref:TetR/AcrR family transcriptional regulator n=1 Tax=Desertihabitans aurantiacus TaxID=2282477 RepID=UPI000DF7CE00|nr:TetR/AcrR family transcriptional regulator [Desertihabitans aurantiacus]